MQTQHIADTSVPLGKFEPLWHVRVRLRPETRGVTQIRTGPILTTALNNRVALIGGYYYTREKRAAWTTVHRPFGGAELFLWARVFEVDARSLLERHVSKSRSDFSIFRNRIRITPVGITAPYLGIEAFVDSDGFNSIRYSAGVRRTIAEELILDFGYFYENRTPRAGSDRHMFTTTIHWRNQDMRLDPDP